MAAVEWENEFKCVLVCMFVTLVGAQMRTSQPWSTADLRVVLAAGITGLAIRPIANVIRHWIEAPLVFAQQELEELRRTLTNGRAELADRCEQIDALTRQLHESQRSATSQMEVLREQLERIEMLKAQLAAAVQVASERVTRVDWQELADAFEALKGMEVRADWSKSSSGIETWSISSAAGDCPDCDTLCRQAGAMLLRSPYVFGALSGPVHAQTEPLWRWLEYVKEHSGGLSSFHHATHTDTDGTERTSYFGRLESLDEKSVRLALDCATTELVGA